MTPRSTLKDYFKKGKIPKEIEFAELIDSMLIQDEDNILKLPNDPLSIKATGAIDFHYKGLIQDFNTRIINDADGRLSLFAPTLHASGNVGIGTVEPKGVLHVAKNGEQWSSWNYGTNLLIEGGTLARNPAIGIFDAKNDNPWAIANAGGDLYFSQMPLLGVTTTPPKVALMIDKAGNVGIGMEAPLATLHVVASSTGNEWVQSIIGNASGDGTGPKYGVLGSASDGGPKFGGYFGAYSPSNDETTGVSGNASGDGTGTTYGVSGKADGASTGTKYGVYGEASGAGTGMKYGVSARASGGGLKIAGSFQAESADDDEATGVSGNASGSGAGAKYGVSGQVSGFGVKYAGYFEADGAGNDETFGVRSNASGDGTGAKYGVYGVAEDVDGAETYGVYGSASTIGTLPAYGVYGIVSSFGTNGYAGYFKGNVHVDGDLTVTGAIHEHFADLAENYISTADLNPGDVVCLDPANDLVNASDQPNDGLVLGVVSTSPAFLLNSNCDQSAGKAFPIALCGRVPCKVVAENGPIKRGDLLTSASTVGHAMKAMPIVMDGTGFYRPGTIIGKALGALESGAGTIDIFVCLR